MTDSTAITPFGGLHGSGNDKTQFELIVELQRELAAAQEELAERKEGFARMEFAIQQLEQQCNEARTRAESAERERDEARRDAERLRGTLEIFHSHGYDREVCGAAIAEGK